MKCVLGEKNVSSAKIFKTIFEDVKGVSFCCVEKKRSALVKVSDLREIVKSTFEKLSAS